MHVADIELCKRLYELSGWDNGEPWSLHSNGELYPAYDLGYLIRKLPKTIKHSITGEELAIGTSWRIDKKKWIADYEWSSQPHGLADTPENAAAKLAIELFEQGILTKDNN